MKQWQLGVSLAILGAVIPASRLASGQVPLTRICGEAKAPACDAVRGDRSEGWVPQTRSEVMARNGIVSTVQPLAAQAGLRILQQGGNAIDAAVATAAMLNVVFPQNVGIGGDLFALIYVAKEKKVYQLNASGITPAGLTLARMQSLGDGRAMTAYDDSFRTRRMSTCATRRRCARCWRGSGWCCRTRGRGGWSRTRRRRNRLRRS